MVAWFRMELESTVAKQKGRRVIRLCLRSLTGAHYRNVEGPARTWKRQRLDIPGAQPWSDDRKYGMKTAKCEFKSLRLGLCRDCSTEICIVSIQPPVPYFTTVRSSPQPAALSFHCFLLSLRFSGNKGIMLHVSNSLVRFRFMLTTGSLLWE